MLLPCLLFPSQTLRFELDCAGHEGLVSLLAGAGVSFGAAPKSTARRFGPMLVMLVPFVYLGFAGWMLYSSSRQHKGAPVGKRQDQKRKPRNPVLFSDAAGQDGAKAELLGNTPFVCPPAHCVLPASESALRFADIVRFLQRPEAYHRVGAVMPKGALLAGPSGTGKTLLARAVAGECGLPFFSCSASDFVEVYVGLGASRVRGLFEAARKASQAPGASGAIVFIDEIDALGGARSVGTAHPLIFRLPRCWCGSRSTQRNPVDVDRRERSGAGGPAQTTSESRH